MQVLVRAVSLQLQETPLQKTPLQETPLQDTPLETPLACDQEKQTCSSFVKVTQVECVYCVYT